VRSTKSVAPSGKISAIAIAARVANMADGMTVAHVANMAEVVMIAAHVVNTAVAMTVASVKMDVVLMVTGIANLAMRGTAAAVVVKGTSRGVSTGASRAMTATVINVEAKVAARIAKGRISPSVNIGAPHSAVNPAARAIVSKRRARTGTEVLIVRPLGQRARSLAARVLSTAVVKASLTIVLRARTLAANHPRKRRGK
jgi:hypothetical protein